MKPNYDALQRRVDQVAHLMSAAGYPPEMTHKRDLLNVRMFGGMPSDEIVAHTLVEAWSSKAALATLIQTILGLQPAS